MKWTKPSLDKSSNVARGAGPPTIELADATIRVLVAEDNPVNQRVAVRMLERLGLRADVAADGHEALGRLGTTSYALILMDCQMPELDGYEVTARIRAREEPGHRTPIIAMTAAAMQGDRERCLAAGMDDYISKPVRLNELRTTLERWLPPTNRSDQFTAGTDEDPSLAHQ
jgi:two-component system sensor histidine kinase/response regulator